MTGASRRDTLRKRNRERTQDDLQSVAMRLFGEQGYAATTVAQIAGTAGVSQRTFFRCFRSKEDLVVDAPVGYGAVLAAELAARPREEGAMTAVLATVRLRTASWQARPEFAAQVTELLAGSPALRASLHGKTTEWHAELAGVLRDRLDGPPATRALRADAVVGVVIACLDAAFQAWLQDPGRDLDALLDDALDVVVAPASRR